MEFPVEVVVSSWPFRLSTVVYEPLSGVTLAQFDPLALVGTPDALPGLEDIVEPKVPYRRRADAALAVLNADQAHLRAALDVDEDDPSTVVLTVSDAVEKALAAFCDRHALPVGLFAAHRIDELFDALEQRSVAEERAFLADWWSTFEAQDDAPLADPLYGPDGRDRWQADVDSGPAGFSLLVALRVHLAWREEFPEAPRPRISAIDALSRMLQRAS